MTSFPSQGEDLKTNTGEPVPDRSLIREGTVNCELWVCGWCVGSWGRLQNSRRLRRLRPNERRRWGRIWCRERRTVPSAQAAPISSPRPPPWRGRWTSTPGWRERTPAGRWCVRWRLSSWSAWGTWTARSCSSWAAGAACAPRIGAPSPVPAGPPTAALAASGELYPLHSHKVTPRSKSTGTKQLLLQWATTTAPRTLLTSVFCL